MMVVPLREPQVAVAAGVVGAVAHCCTPNHPGNQTCIASNTATVSGMTPLNSSVSGVHIDHINQHLVQYKPASLLPLLLPQGLAGPVELAVLKPEEEHVVRLHCQL